MREDFRGLGERIGNIKLFLLDLDGTVYLEDEPIEGALEFINNLRKNGVEYVFLTNNSSKNSRQYLEKLSKMGFPVTSENVFTSGQATAIYLSKQKERPKIYLVGTAALKAELQECSIEIADEESEAVDFVVIGFDTELVYKKLEHACFLIDRNVPFIATNPDLVCPVRDHRYIPDCGSICQMIFNATGRRPVYIGKPDKKMVEILSEKRGIGLGDIAMIGDRLYTDIALGNNAGITSVCVLSGESSWEKVLTSPHRPDFVIESIDTLNRFFNGKKS